MIINKIKKIGKKYRLELDDGTFINTYGDIIIKYNILYHKDIDIETVNSIEKENIYYDAYQDVIIYITKKLRSEYEVKRFLDKYLISLCEKEKIILKLKELNLINDRIVAKAFINDKLSFTNNGPYKIRKELELLKIDENIINDVFYEIDSSIYYDKVKKIIEKKLKLKQKYSGNVLKQKLINELKNMGYSSEVIYDVLDNVVIKGDIIKEYDKLYNKFKLKYNEVELDKKIEQKLYSLGYSRDDIEKITRN